MRLKQEVNNNNKDQESSNSSSLSRGEQLQPLKSVKDHPSRNSSKVATKQQHPLKKQSQRGGDFGLHTNPGFTADRYSPRV